MRIAIASGKGGTGKTLVATSLAWWLAQRGTPVTYVDADVEEPNGHLFLHPEPVGERRVPILIPAVDASRCTHCAICQTTCAFHALLVMPTHWMIFEELCHSCGACVAACPERALSEKKVEIGTLRLGQADGLEVLTGVLDVGQARATPVIEATVASAPKERLRVVDCPPGTSCSAVASVRGADLVILVTEPTPFGLHDLELAVRMCQALDLEVAAVINRADLGDEAVREFLEEEDIPLLGTLSFDPHLAKAIAKGQLAVKASSEVRSLMSSILDYLTEEAP
ncbi:MAG: ATP-binding protein [Deltaproteobacteria bacterium]|nr:ATP-binding protein [Deltaproteobacteria bacterium]